MTAELCDCYPTKTVGVNAVLDAVLDAFPGVRSRVWGVDGRFHDVDGDPRAARARGGGQLAGAGDAGRPAGARRAGRS